MPSISLRVNGSLETLDVPAPTLLVTLLREQLRLTGTHVGCDTSSCGACTILLDGQSVKSCTVLAMQAAGHDVITIEGVADGKMLHPMQEAFRSEHGLQCGFCTPGMIMSSIAIVERNRDPSDDDIRNGLAGNICRCTGYENIVRAVNTGARAMRAQEALPR